MKNEKKGIFQRFWNFTNHWIKLGLEVILFGMIVVKVIPDSWVTSGWFLFILLLVTLVGLFFTNFSLMWRAATIADKIRDSYEQTQQSMRDSYELQLEELRSQLSKIERKSRYVEILPMLNSAFQELHNAIRKNYQDKTKYHEHFVVCCYNLEKVFTKITGAECHVCIKMTQFPNDQIPSINKANKNVPNVLLRTYCRSSASAASRNQIDFKKNITHPVKENTDFESIYGNKKEYYYCEDLTTLDVYKNSSLKAVNGSYTINPKKHLAAGEAWPLNYKTVLVAPISPIIKESKEDHIILGVLCVDSAVPGIFNEEFDKHIIIGCADGIYNSFYNIFNQPNVNRN